MFSLWSTLQAMVESLLKEFPNVLTLRVRMPIVTDLTYERNFITKIIKYDKVSLLLQPRTRLLFSTQSGLGRILLASARS